MKTLVNGLIQSRYDLLFYDYTWNPFTIVFQNIVIVPRKFQHDKPPPNFELESETTSSRGDTSLTATPSNSGDDLNDNTLGKDLVL